MLFPHTKQVDGKTRWYNWLRWQGRTINKSRMRYRASKSGDSGGDDGSNPPSSGGGTPPSSTTDWPDYSSILREYYEITRAMPWEGRVNSLRALSPANLVGRRLAITGARRDYQEMATSVTTSPDWPSMGIPSRRPIMRHRRTVSLCCSRRSSPAIPTPLAK